MAVEDHTPWIKTSTATTIFKPLSGRLPAFAPEMLKQLAVHFQQEPKVRLDVRILISLDAKLSHCARPAATA